MKWPRDSTTEDVHKLMDEDEGVVMHQITPPKVILQAGSAPLGWSRPAQNNDPDVVQFDIPVEDDSPKLEKPELKIYDDDGNEVDGGEIFDEIYKDKE